jgi:galactokinase
VGGGAVTVDLQRVPDVESLVRRVGAGGAGPFQPHRPVLLSRAPGRLDVMGGIAEHGGSAVLQATLDRAVALACQRRDDQQVLIRALGGVGADPPVQCCWPLAVLYDGPNRLTSAPRFAAYLHRAGWGWAQGIAGLLYAVLEAQAAPHLGGGATFVLDSTVPPGAGIGWSAAVTAAAIQALCGLYGLQLGSLVKASLCRRADQVMAEAPWDIRNPLTALVGEPDGLLQLRGRLDELPTVLPLPKRVKVVGIDSGVRGVANEKYAEARVAASMGWRILSTLPGWRAEDAAAGQCLANVSPEEFVKHFRDLLPARMAGKEFLEQYRGTAEPAAWVAPERVYRVRSRTEHQVYESRRVQQFAACISRANRTGREEPVVEAGRLMYASHWSYGQRCGLATIPTDLLVNLLRQRGPEAGLFGARVTDVGTGGTVAVLMRDDTQAFGQLQSVMEQYRAKTGREPELFDGGSPGAELLGWQELRP